MPANRIRLLPTGLLLLAAAPVVSFARDLPKTAIPIERYYQYPLINGRSPSSPRMDHAGKRIVFGWNTTGERKLDLWTMDFPGGAKRRIVKADDIAKFPRQDDERTDLEKKEEDLYDGGIGSAQWSQDDKALLFAYRGRTWLADADGKNLRPIVDAAGAIAAPQFTRDGRYLLYSNGQNVLRFELKTGAVKQLTFLSKSRTAISQFEMSPDGRTLMVVWSDSSKTSSHVMMDFSKDRAKVVNIQRDWNGDLSENSQIGLVGADGGIVKYVYGFPRTMWLKDVEWAPDSSKFAVAYISEDDKAFTLSTVDARTGTRFDAYKETAAKDPDLTFETKLAQLDKDGKVTKPAETRDYSTINDWRNVVWTRDSRGMLLGTDLLDGKPAHRSIVRVSLDGTKVIPVFAEGYDVGAFMRPENSDRLILVTAANSPLTTEITILEPNGKRTVHNVLPDGYDTPKGFNWAELPLVSDDGKRIATLASSRTMPSDLYAVEPKMERLTVSQPAEFQKIKWATFERVSFPGPDGTTLYGHLVYDPNLDRSKRHPAFLSSIYADSGKGAWGGFLENYAAMELGMVCLVVDYRSSWGYGEKFNGGYNGRLGQIDADEAVSAKNYLASLPYIRSDRVGIWGWSYGGYLTLMTLLTKPGVFDTGVAVAPVTNWKSYNEWYTRRRLGLVKEDGGKRFEMTSPVTYASGLKDNLLIVHGMLDDNVLFQDTAQMMQAFVENGRYFDVMAYPRDDHSIGKDTSRPHVFGTIMRYLYDHLNRP